MEVNNSSGDAFNTGVYWKLLDQMGPDLDESMMEVEDICFKVPAIPAAEHVVKFEDRTKKELQ